MAKFIMHKKIATSDLNRKGCLKVQSMVDYMQDCSVFQLNSEKALDDFFNRENAGMFLSQRDIHMIRMPRYGEDVDVVTWVYELYPSYGYRNSNIYDASGNICVESSALGVFVHYSTGKLLRIPDEIMATVPIYERHPMDYKPRKISIPKAITPVDCGLYRVKEYSIDGNGHVNNAWYPIIAAEYLPREFEYTRLRIEYPNPALYDADMRVMRYDVEGGYIIQLMREDGKPYAVIEFLEK